MFVNALIKLVRYKCWRIPANLALLQSEIPLQQTLLQMEGFGVYLMLL